MVCVPHGWGHSEHGGRHARSQPGGNINTVLRGGQTMIEPVSGQAIMVGQSIRLSRANSRTKAKRNAKAA